MMLMREKVDSERAPANASPRKVNPVQQQDNNKK